VKGWTVSAQRRQDYRQGRFDSSAREAGARGVNHHYEKQIDLAARFRRVRRWNAMDALDCANFSSERTCRTESSPTDSTHFTATHRAEPITAAYPFTVPDDFSNKANFTNATADADSLNPG
ncbi:MAG: hypothetical protein WA183_06490, partial [Chthoniobacterales bacterium]